MGVEENILLYQIKMVLLAKTSHLVINTLERFFYWWGKFVSLHPYPVICSCILVTAVSTLGFLRFGMEHRANKLLIPADSPYNMNEVATFLCVMGSLSYSINF